MGYFCRAGLVTVFNEHRINLPSISDIEETVPALNNEPQELKGSCAAITDDPCQNSSLLVINGCPNPKFVALVADKGKAVHPSRLLLGCLQIQGHLEVDVPMARIQCMMVVW